MMFLLSFLGKNVGTILGFAFGGLLSWQVANFVHQCPKIVPCPVCPPQNVTNYHIHNDKIKVKNGGTIDIEQMIKDNKNTTNNALRLDSTAKTDKVKEKRGWWDIFRKKKPQ